MDGIDIFYKDRQTRIRVILMGKDSREELTGPKFVNPKVDLLLFVNPKSHLLLLVNPKAYIAIG